MISKQEQEVNTRKHKERHDYQNKRGHPNTADKDLCTKEKWLQKKKLKSKERKHRRKDIKLA